ncbi:Meiotically up-regulated protein [Lachnellula willkommii]|uniref:Meiotically up-regulated protein n=1 Tax=Lachnellula willkommii TaxID=215461 RepID=A0A559MAV1_9HELO|nr:Meiotically up-regulated protein [Lachnellula willkommii]
MHRTTRRPAPLDFSLPPNSAYGIDRRKYLGVPHSQFSPVYLEAPVRDGLHTPPGDNMGTTYQHPQYTNYAGRQDPPYSIPSVGQNGYAGAYTGASAAPRQYSTLSQPTAQVPSQIPTSALRNEVQNVLAPYRQPSSPAPASRTNIMRPVEEQSRRKSTNGDMIIPSLQIPSSINNSGGSLAEFAAQITCLFWFESTDTLNRAENMGPSSSPIKRLRNEALPSSGFRKWVVTILSTTQVTQNVILLALLFIYRLKKINPAVKGRSGSEYRLLTVALMLGNKCTFLESLLSGSDADKNIVLDDNTYTNKTWADVSGISVTEIHVMEVEFLSNMRYSLLASESQWKDWQAKLGKFWTFCDRASKAPVPQYSPSTDPILPSPPVSMQASPPSQTPSLASGFPSSSTSASSSHYNQQWPVNNYPTPLPSMPEHELRSTRKRSYEGEAEEPAPKRITRLSPNGPAGFAPTAPPMRHDVPRLPVPNLTISTSQPMSTGYNSASSLNGPLLPPIGNGRSMSSVYPTTPSWTPHLPVLTPTGPPSQHGPHGAGGYTTPSRRQSPHSVQELLSLGSSPISANFPHNPGHISPSLFLQQRNSPYKPVRHVNTLLYPPPSGSMQGFSANPGEMHYQPLGRRNDYRSGVVPEYSYPYQQHPVLPQPNFHA